MKRIVAIVMVLSVVLSFGVFASNDTEGLEKAILRVKSITEVPEWLDEFEYTVSKTEDETVWHLNWHDKKYVQGSLNVSVNDKGDILSFDRNNYEVENKGETVDISEAIKTAELYAATILGDDYAKMKISNADIIPLDSTRDNFIVKFERFENGIPVRGQTCILGINKYTGVFESYTGFEFDRETTFVMPDKIISNEEALEAFDEKLGLKLQYRKYYDYSKKETNVFLAYSNEKRDCAIDAATGEIYKSEAVDENSKYLFNDSVSMESAGAGYGTTLSEQEVKAIDELQKLITVEEAQKILGEKIDSFKGKTATTSIITKKYNSDDEYILELNYLGDEGVYGYATLDATTGEILSFFRIIEDAKMLDEPLTEDERAKQAEEFARKVAGDKFAQTKKDDENGMKFVRQVNGIDFVGDGITVYCNAEYGYVESYNLNWTKVENFPNVNEAKDSKGITAKVAGDCKYELIWIDGVLCYDFKDKSVSLFSPYTGKAINRDGSEKKIAVTYKYYDISGHWCEKMLDKLSENNIGLEQDLFVPDGKITLKDFIKLVYHERMFENDDKLAEFAEGLGIFENCALDSEVKRYDAAKVYASKLGLYDIAGKSEIFVKPFVDCDDVNNGYVAVCTAKGIFAGDGSGYFRGEDTVTKAETVSLVYKFFVR